MAQRLACEVVADELHVLLANGGVEPLDGHGSLQAVVPQHGPSEDLPHRALPDDRPPLVEAPRRHGQHAVLELPQRMLRRAAAAAAGVVRPVGFVVCRRFAGFRAHPSWEKMTKLFSLVVEATLFLFGL